jgi:hypothetical protein
MENSFINVHNFDGQLKDKYSKKRIYSNEEKEESFTCLIKLIKNTFAKKAIVQILNDMKNNNSIVNNNFQMENNLDASDILKEIIDNIFYNNNCSMFQILEEQLSDAYRLGMCNSGRCTRLLQVWLCLNF